MNKFGEDSHLKIIRVVIIKKTRKNKFFFSFSRVQSIICE